MPRQVGPEHDLDELLEHVLDAAHAAVPFGAAGVFVLDRSLL